MRFDDEVGRPLLEHGSVARVTPLATAAKAVVHVVHVPPGGRIGRHRAAEEQLFCVVHGSGSVSGPGTSRTLVAGYGALFAPGEQRDFESETGATVVCLEGDISILCIAVTREVVVVEYDDSWPSRFEEIASVVWPAVRDVALRIDHVGSTSVPGLAAKPIIDMDVVIAPEASVAEVISRLAEIGYAWRGDLGVRGREAFSAPADGPSTAHHLYLVVEGSRPHLDHVLLRDLLRRDEEARRRYGEAKKVNAASCGGDIEAYLSAKAGLVAELLTRARAEAGLEPVAYWEG